MYGFHICDIICDICDICDIICDICDICDVTPLDARALVNRWAQALLRA